MKTANQHFESHLLIMLKSNVTRLRIGMIWPIACGPLYSRPFTLPLYLRSLVPLYPVTTFVPLYLRTLVLSYPCTFVLYHCTYASCGLTSHRYILEYGSFIRSKNYSLEVEGGTNFSGNWEIKPNYIAEWGLTRCLAEETSLSQEDHRIDIAAVMHLFLVP